MKPRKILSLGLILTLLGGGAAPVAAQKRNRGKAEGASRSAVSSNRTKAKKASPRGAGPKKATPKSAKPKKATARPGAGPGRGPSASKAARSGVRRGKHPRRRSYRGVVVVRPHGHWYHGYGLHYHDDSAWKWMAFTAITLKVLDNINEEQQRKHEAAQIEATTAAVGQPVAWQEGGASGSVTTMSESHNAAGEYCREFQQEITVGGETEQAYGTACLQPDGAWKIVSD
jgi:hypothetical protein